MIPAVQGKEAGPWYAARQLPPRLKGRDGVTSMSSRAVKRPTTLSADAETRSSSLKARMASISASGMKRFVNN
jgi:hypothetical protein